MADWPTDVPHSDPPPAQENHAERPKDGPLPQFSNERDKLIYQLRQAQDMVNDLCSGKREWIMSIPARPDHDPDLIIGSALRDALAYIRSHE